MTELQGLYFKMLRIRRVEEAIARRYPEQEMRCPVHLSIGQEAAAVGICHGLTKDDLMVSTHRSHAHYLAKGGSIVGLLGELYGKDVGCSRGFGGSMHLVANDVGFIGSTSIVGGTIPVGVGLAFAKKIRGESGRVIVCIGDAAIEEGVFHESANFASLHDLPVVFACENNLYSCYTHLRDRQPYRPFERIAEAHSLAYINIDGNNVGQVAGCIPKDLTKPLFIELRTYRHLEHCGPNNDDHLGYRDVEETQLWLDRDPLAVGRHHAKEDHPAATLLTFCIARPRLAEVHRTSIVRSLSARLVPFSVHGS